jgi:hypothetical protein
VPETKVESKEIFKKWVERSIIKLKVQMDKNRLPISDKYKIKYVISSDFHWKDKRKTMRDAICEIKVSRIDNLYNSQHHQTLT